MSCKGHSAGIEFDDEDGLLVDRIADAVGFHGASVSEITDAFREAAEDHVCASAKIGKRSTSQPME